MAGAGQTNPIRAKGLDGRLRLVLQTHMIMHVISTHVVTVENTNAWSVVQLSTAVQSGESNRFRVA